MKAIEQYLPVVLFIMFYKVVLSFESVGEILKCDHSNESHRAVLRCVAVYYAIRGGLNYESVNEITKCDPLIHAIEPYFSVAIVRLVFHSLKNNVRDFFPNFETLHGGREGGI